MRVDADGALVVDHPDGRVERRAEPGAITKVVLARDPAEVGVPAARYAVGLLPADEHGVLVFLTGDRPVLAVRLAEWIPSPADFDGRTAREVSGANAVAAALDLPIEPANASAPVAGDARRALVSPHPAAPRRAMVVIGASAAAVVAWLVASAVHRYTGGERHAAFGLLGALGSLGLTGTWLVLRTRASHRLPQPPGHEVRPAPAEPVPRGFLRSRLFVSPDWVVIVDALGREAWLPGPALGGTVAAAVTSTAIVLDDEHGNGLAALPRVYWAGDPESERALRTTLERVGVVVRDEPSNRDPGAWLADPRALVPMDDPFFGDLREARGVPGFAGGFGGGAGAVVTLSGILHGEAITVALAGLAAVAAFVVAVHGHLATRRDGRVR